ncbi:MAG: glycosyltransferase family 4 protein [Candidatus Anammoximicrobium sp.]|nr:glycosyltransferase family 4 protein [Candidatus Anammoximicrobium sp.]
MHGLRVVFITPRFWPLFGGPEDVVATLAVGLQRRGAEPTVLTAGWDPHWSPQMVYRQIPVVRLAHPGAGGWGTVRYLIALARWLRRHRDEIDLLYVAGLGPESLLARRVLGVRPIPIVVRPDQPDGREGRSPCRWLVRRRCQAAAAAVVPDPAAARAASAAGLPDECIYRIADGVRESVSERASDRLAARRALAEVNSMFSVADDAPVAVCVGRLRKGRRLPRLLEAWRPVAKRWPGARLWLIGDGPFRDPLDAYLGDLDLRLSVLLPGSFDNISDALAAANLLVEPSADPVSPQPLREAIALGLPVVGCHLETLQQTPAWEAGTARFAGPDETAALSRAMLDLLAQPPAADALAAARGRVLAEYGSSRMIDEHLHLFDRLVQRCHSQRPA